MLTIGTDTEFFLVDPEGKFLAAHKFIKGSKHKPTILSNGGNVTYDNVALEFATPPVATRKEFVKAVYDTMKEALSHLPSHVSVLPMGSADFPEDELKDRRCREFGCDPDFDAWTVMENIVPPGATEKPFRSCGGHLHIGFVENSGNDFLLDPYGKIDTVRALDIIAGIPMTILDNTEDSVNRRKLYGKAGCHRPTSYGVEYRTLSNFWTKSPMLVELVYCMAEDALKIVKQGKLDSLITNIPESAVTSTINNGDKITASNLWSKYVSKEVSKATKDLFAKCRRKRGFDLYKEWKL